MPQKTYDTVSKREQDSEREREREAPLLTAKLLNDIELTVQFRYVPCI